MKNSSQRRALFVLTLAILCTYSQQQDESTIDEIAFQYNDNDSIQKNSTTTTTTTTTPTTTTVRRPVEILNDKHAALFKEGLSAKSSKLYKLTLDYSGFALLNETYNTQLKEDANFAWINFTSMIMNISRDISQILGNKTSLVKSLSDSVELAFDDYKNNNESILESTNYIYYDAKSPKTFCDVAEAFKKSVAEKDMKNSRRQVTTTTTPKMTTKTISQVTTLENKQNRKRSNTRKKKSEGSRTRKSKIFSISVEVC